MPSRHAPLSRHHTNYFAVSRITPWKKGQSRHHANRLGYLLKMCSCKKENNGEDKKVQEIEMLFKIRLNVKIIKKYSLKRNR